MKVFDKRPLSLILCILLGAFVFFTLGTNAARAIIIVVAVSLIFLSVFIKNLKKSQKTSLVLFSVLIIFASLLSYVYFNLWFFANNRYEDRCEIVGTVEKINFEGSVNTLDFNADTINGDYLSSYKLKVVLDENDINNITIGTKLKFTANLTALSASKEECTTLCSDGFSAKATSVESLSVIGYQQPGLKHKIAEYRNSLARRIVIHSNSESGGILAALLLGNRAYLSGSIRLDFSRIGISHVLALSGMHLVIICYAISKILAILGVDKRGRKVFEILLTIFYMALTGFSISVMRAGLMIILSALLFLFSGSKDSLTNLFISVSLIILIQPYAVYDLSLWLSAFATLGIIVFAQLSENLTKTKEKRILSFFAPFLSSAFAISATLIISSISFDTISSVSIITTVIFSPIIFIFMHIGLLYLFTASFLPLGKIIILIGRCISDLSHFFSKFKYSLLSAEFSVTKVLILSLTILFFLFLVLDIRKRKTALLVLLVMLLGTILSSFVFTANQFSQFKFQYDTTDDSEKIFISENSEILLIDIETPGSSKSIQTTEYLFNKNILYLDNYFVTSYNEKSISAFKTIFSRIYVENLYVPLPKDTAQTKIFEEIITLQHTYKTNLIVYEENEIIDFENFSLVPIYCDTYGKFALTINYKNEFYTYISADMLEPSTVMHSLKIMNGANTVVVGRSDNKSSNSFIYKLKGNTKIIFNEKSGLTNEILDYYKDRITVDPNGAVDLYVE